MGVREELEGARKKKKKKKKQKVRLGLRFTYRRCWKGGRCGSNCIKWQGAVCKIDVRPGARVGGGGDARRGS